MATLAGTTIADTYDSLLHVEDNTAGLVDTATDSRVIQDGVGANSALALATDSVRITSTNKLYFNDVGGEYISGNGSILSIVGGNEIDLTATAIDINGTADISGAVGLASSSGVTTIGSSNGLTVSAAGVLTVNSATDSTSKTTGSTIIDGGVGIAKTLHVGTGIVEEGGVLKENLLTNSGFDVWSNSTLVEATSGAAPVLDGANSALTNNLITNGGFDSATTGWASSVGAGSAATLANVGSGKTGNCLRVTAASSTATGASTSFGCVIGKLYQVTYHYNRGDIAALSSAIGTSAYPSLGYDSIHGYGEVTGETETDTDFSEAVTYVFEATATTHYLTIFGTMGATQVMYIDSVTAYEVTPGCVADNSLAMDGWMKESTTDVWREHNGTYTKDGSFYSLKVTAGSASDYLVWTMDANNTWASGDPRLHRFDGRTVTMGVWAWTATGSTARIQLQDGGGTSPTSTYSDYHTGGSGWEWLEVTKTFNVDAAERYVYLRAEANGSTIYYSQPMLVFGSSIGEGNYTRPQGEIVYFENDIASVKLNQDSFSDVAVETINLEADSQGAIPKGAQAVLWRGHGRDSGSAGTDCYFHTRKDSTASWAGVINPAGLANDAWARSNLNLQPCNNNGDMDYIIEATGSSTFDLYVYYNGVQLR